MGVLGTHSASDVCDVGGGQLVDHGLYRESDSPASCRLGSHRGYSLRSPALAAYDQKQEMPCEGSGSGKWDSKMPRALSKQTLVAGNDNVGGGGCLGPHGSCDKLTVSDWKRCWRDMSILYQFPSQLSQ